MKYIKTLGEKIAENFDRLAIIYIILTILLISTMMIFILSNTYA